VCCFCSKNAILVSNFCCNKSTAFVKWLLELLFALVRVMGGCATSGTSFHALDRHFDSFDKMGGHPIMLRINWWKDMKTKVQAKDSLRSRARLDLCSVWRLYWPPSTFTIANYAQRLVDQSTSYNWGLYRPPSMFVIANYAWGLVDQSAWYIWGLYRPQSTFVIANYARGLVDQTAWWNWGLYRPPSVFTATNYARGLVD
jgi:hypothetical protein